jgi:hypothetical protein
VPAGACAADAGGLQASGSWAMARAPANSNSAPQQTNNRFMMDLPLI